MLNGAPQHAAEVSHTTPVDEYPSLHGTSHCQALRWGDRVRIRNPPLEAEPIVDVRGFNKG